MGQPKPDRDQNVRHPRANGALTVEPAGSSALAQVAAALDRFVQASGDSGLARERERLVAVLSGLHDACRQLESQARALRAASDKAAGRRGETRLRRFDEAVAEVAKRRGEAEQQLVRLARRVDESKSGGPGFWEAPRGLELRAARYDARTEELVVAFRSGARYRLPSAALRLSASVTSARLDEARHGAMLRLADGTETSVASDLVLYECEPAYRATHRHIVRRQMDFGRRIRSLRLAQGRTARQVAHAAGLAPSNYARLEASRHQPRVETLVRVAEALGVPLAELVRVG